MTPAEHYAEAERLLEAAKADVRTVDAHDAPAGARPFILDRASIAIACAGVHARLAAGAVR